MRTRTTLFALLAVTICSAQSWSELSSGVSTHLRDVFFIDPSHGWVVGDQGTIIATTDGGATWVPQSAAVGTFTLRSVFFTSPTDGWITGASDILLKTTDGGATWTAASTGSTESYGDIWFLTPQLGYLVGGTGLTGTVSRTTDGGATWTTTHVDRVLEAVHFNASGQGWACGSRGVIYHSANGTGWAQQAPPGADQLSNLVNIFMLNDLEGWSVGNPSSIRHTVDGGTTWTDQVSGTIAGKTAIYFSDAQSGWATSTSPLGGGDPVRRTTDGTTWAALDMDNLPTLNNMRFLNPDLGWAVGEYGTLLRYGTGTASVAELDTAPLRISPNPVMDRLDLTGAVDRAEVFNSTGQPVFRTEAPHGSIDVSSLKPGCYAVRATTSNTIRTARFIKE